MNQLMKNTFIELFNQNPEVRAVAPGRVNIIGEHTDYNEGYVLPVALQYHADILVCKLDTDTAHVQSLQYPESKDTFSVNKEISTGPHAWSNYIRGIVIELQKRGHAISGFGLLMTSNVPQGSGLSSSAALEVAVTGALNDLFELNLAHEEIALIGQAAENNFIDCQCGIMDQLISASAVEGHAVMIDCLDLQTHTVAIPKEQAIVIINSNYPRKLADSEYNERRMACNKAADAMAVTSLRHADLAKLQDIKDVLDDVTYRRAKHVITENQRVIDTIDAFAQNNIQRFYDIMHAGQKSLENDFEITVEATEVIVKLCLDATNGQAGVRQTGGGFGGAVVCICHHTDVSKVRDAINDNYTKNTGLAADIYVCQASQGLVTEKI